MIWNRASCRVPLEPYARKLFGLTIKPDRLQQIRNERASRQPLLVGGASGFRSQRRGVLVRAAWHSDARCDGSLDRRNFEQNSRPHRHRTAPAPLTSRKLRGIVRGMLADQWCETTWRAQPGSFVSLMTLYESNFVRLGWLVNDLRTVTRAPCFAGRRRTVISISSRRNCAAIPVCFVSHMSSNSSAAPVRDPDLEVCVYHDARLGRGAQLSRIPAPSATRQAAGPDSSVNWISAGPET